MAMDQHMERYNLLGGWTSIDPKYFDVTQAEMPRGGDRGSQNSGENWELCHQQKQRKGDQKLMNWEASLVVA